MKKQFSNDMVPRKMPKGKSPTATTKRQQKVGSPVPKEATKKPVNPVLTWPLSGIVVTMEE
jgi:hypothetical protein